MTINIKEIKAIRVATGAALAELGAERKDIVALDADLAHATMSCTFGEKFPDRFFNCGIAEQNMICMAAGLAISGFVPVASTFAMFGAGRAYEQVRNSVCYPHLNVKLVFSHSGLSVGEDGGSHQAIEDISLMRSIPGMTVLVPCDGNEARKALRAAVTFKGPVYIRAARLPSPVFTADDAPFEIGKAVTLREGGDVAIIATGLMVYQALLAAEELEKTGIQATVLNIHSIKPIDRQAIIDVARKTRRVITVEEHSVIGGLGSAVAEVLSEECPTALKRMGVQDRFGQSGTPEALLDYYGLTSKHIVETAKEVVERVK
ncbi:transketolase family protein [Telmatospirillum sp.]|uniref:transketolase family protein n=1 Tax=Telmatospirillum sp. TaxID=2079197 RepID=UPI00283BF7AD|nr:transketolase family protein [Telmatospirillum sp.]MDR3438671.1 transketolase family protein [Telmatospirillum sp.]